MTTVMNIIDKQKGAIIMCDSKGDTCLCFITLSNTQREHFQELVRPEWFLGVKLKQTNAFYFFYQTLCRERCICTDKKHQSAI